MNLPYYYWFFPSAIPQDVCDKILELGITTLVERKEKYGEKSVNGSVGGWRQKNLDDKDSIPSNEADILSLSEKGVDLDKVYVRDSETAFLSNRELFELVWPYVHSANEKAGWNFEWDYTEDFQFTKYGPGQFYGWHCDSADKPYELFNPEVHAFHKNPDGTPHIDQYGEMIPEDHNCTTNPNYIGKIRKLSVTISLNNPEEYEGGNLKFDLGPNRIDRYHECTQIRPKGSVVVFPSHLYHQVTPVTKGTRYSLVCWNLGKPFK